MSSLKEGATRSNIKDSIGPVPNIPPPAPKARTACNREFLGKIVRMEWEAWAREQPNPKPSWLTPWAQLTEPEREVDRRIGERIHDMVHGMFYEPPALWQPIETAPKDGTWMIIFVADSPLYANPFMARWDKRPGGGWWAGFDGYGEDDLVRAPTHWMPLPEPPK